MKRSRVSTCPVLGLLAGVLITMSLASLVCGQDSASSGAKRNPGNAVRGKYIVEDVAMCGQCHTPRESNGAPNREQALQGAPVWLQPAHPEPDWPLQAPRIGGAPPGTDAEMVKLLTTGVWKDGKFLRPPMPQFRMSREDAEAVVAYLKSLQPQAK